VKPLPVRDASTAVTRMLGCRPCHIKNSRTATNSHIRVLWYGLVYEMSAVQTSLSEIGRAAGISHHSIVSEQIEEWFRLPWTTRYSWLRLASGFAFDGWTEDVEQEVRRLQSMVDALKSGGEDWPAPGWSIAKSWKDRPRIGAACTKVRNANDDDDGRCKKEVS